MRAFSSLAPRAKADVRSENRDKTETYLAFGASRFEACRPLVVEGLRLSLMPAVNQMRCAARESRKPFARLYAPSLRSVTGIIAIPGMMSGAILGGADVQQAARLQMIIMFMIVASCALACVVATFLVLAVCLDSEHRIRSERIDKRHHVLRRASSGAVTTVADAVGRAWIRIANSWKRSLGEDDGSDRERAPLLG